MDITRKVIGGALMAGSIVAAASYAQEVEWELTKGYVGVGAGSPKVKLHIFGDEFSGTDKVFQLESAVAPQQVFYNSSSGSKWYFAMTSNNDFKISYDGTGKVEARFSPNGSLAIAGSLSQNSDRNSKQNINEFDSMEVLAKVVALPLSTWEYRSDSGVTHLGPMAQDFHAAFGLGDSPTSISTIDTGGVALAAIQALKREKDVELKELEAEKNFEIAALRDSLAQQAERMLQMEMALAELLRKQSREIRVSTSN
jgi:hypothetical protein